MEWSRIQPFLLAAALALTGPVRAGEPAAPALPPHMTQYYLGLITRGPNSGTGTPEERQRIQDGHMANIARLAKAGQLLVAGPFLDDGNWRGIFIFKCATLAEAQALAASDPAVQAGRLVVEIHPWLTQKGNILDPEFPPPAPAAKSP